ncbi:unnamed protein product [Caenorhabditis nigoni]
MLEIMTEPTSSSSSECSLPVIHSIKDCEVCGLPAHGKHYGAISCRACAAFFRRYGTSGHVKPCKTDGNCVVHKKGWFNCKKCRLEKCKNVGMRIDGFQFGRDPGRVQRGFLDNIPASMATFLGRPNFIIYCAPAHDPDYTPPRVIIDVQFLLDKAEDVLLEGSWSPIFALNPLEKIALGLQHIRSQVGKGMKAFNKIGKEEALTLFEDEMLRTAKWLTYFEDFQRLPQKLQLDMLKGIFKVWVRLDKLHLTARGRRQSLCERWQVMAHINKEQVLCDLSKLELDISWCSRYTVEQLSFFNDPNAESRGEKVVQMMIDLNPTDVELAFMMCQLSFNYVGKRFQGVILDVSDRILDSISNHLHDYYVRRLNMPQYCKRVAQMMKINNHIQQDVIIERSKNELLSVFDVYYADYSHDIFRTV